MTGPSWVNWCYPINVDGHVLAAEVRAGEAIMRVYDDDEDDEWMSG